MYMKQLSENSSSDHVFVLNAAGAAVASFLIVVLVVAGCAVHRLRRLKRNGNSNRERNGESRGETSIQNENEYEIPTNARTRDDSNTTNVYMVPQPNIVYIDLDKRALKNSDTAMPANCPTEYAVIDSKRSSAANKPEERHYANVGNTSVKEASIYANI